MKKKSTINNWYIFIIIAFVTGCQDSLTEISGDKYNQQVENIVVPEDQRTIEIDDQNQFMLFSFESLKFWWSATVQYKIEELTATQKGELESMYNKEGLQYFERDWYDADVDLNGLADGDTLSVVDWFSMSPTEESYGMRPVTMSITRNIEKVPRVIFINFTPLRSDLQPIPFKLIQKAAEPFIEIPMSELQAPVVLSTHIISLTTSERWKVVTDDPTMFTLRDSTDQKMIDLTNNTNYKTRNKVLALTVKTNNTGQQRVGKITFVSLENEDIIQEIIVTQGGEKEPPVVNVEKSPDLFTINWNAVFGHKAYMINFYKVVDGVATNTLVSSHKIILNKKTELNTTFEIDVQSLITNWSLDAGNFYVGIVEPRVTVIYSLSDENESTESLPNPENHVNNLFDSGSGLSENDPIVIKSITHLQNVNMVANANVGFRYYRLDADIDLAGINFIPIGSVLSSRKQTAGVTAALRVQETGGPIYKSPGETGGFVGDFNGNGKKISNFSSTLLLPAFNEKGCPTTVALFSTVSQYSVIRNLTVKDFNFLMDDNGGSITSGLPPNLEYYDYLLIHAPLVAILRDDAVVDNCIAENCSLRFVKNMAGSRYEKNIMSGLVGYALDNAEIKNSVTKGSGFVFSNDKATIGGIVGASRHQTVKITNCVNGMHYIASTGCVVGGIVGRGGGIIEHCANYATIRPSMYTGGIMGQSMVVYGTNAGGGHLNVTNELHATLTVNYGKFGVTGTGDNNINNFLNNDESGGTLSNGGLIGMFDKGVLRQCANFGDLDGHFYNSRAAQATVARWGGLVGESKYSSPQVRYIDCANYGSIRYSIGNSYTSPLNRTYYVGGLFGSFNASNITNVQLGNVINAGEITLTENKQPDICKSQAGNFMGLLSNSTGFTVSNVYVLNHEGLYMNGGSASWSNPNITAKTLDELKSSSIYSGWSNWNVEEAKLPVIKGLPPYLTQYVQH